MERNAILLVLSLSCTLALPKVLQQRSIGGSYTTIEQYPYTAAVLETVDFEVYLTNCGGTILNDVSILTAAHCQEDNPLKYRVRVGSSFVSSGGVVYDVKQIIIHPNYVDSTFDNDISVLRLASPLIFTAVVQPGSIAGPHYNVPDGDVVWAVGWGRTELGIWPEQLRDVQMWTVNQEICKNRYWPTGVTENMICSGWLDVGGRDTCTGDSGGPLLHNNVVVGVCSFGNECGDPYYPGVHTRVSRYSQWIVDNAQ